MSRFPCGFLLHIRIAKSPTATQPRGYNQTRSTNKSTQHIYARYHPKLLCDYTAGSQLQPNQVAVRLISSYQKTPMLRLVGAAKALVASCRHGHDRKWAQSKCHVDNADSMASTRYSISRMCLHLIHHQLCRRWEHHWSWNSIETIYRLLHGWVSVKIIMASLHFSIMFTSIYWNMWY